MGRVPGHLQELGCFIIEELPRTNGELTVETIKRAVSRISTSSRLIGLLKDLSSTTAEAAALLLALYSEAGGEAEPLWIKQQLKEHGLKVSISECMEIFDELVIHHLLGFSDGVYRIFRWDIIAEGKVARDRFQSLLEEKIEEIKGS